MKRFVIFGPGRVGVNFAKFVQALGHQATLLTRLDAEADRAKCGMLIAEADVIAAAIPDSRLAAWAEEWRNVIGERHAIHFSGASRLEGVYGYHPLYSFPKTAIPQEKFSAIAIAREPGAPLWRGLVPGAENPEFVIADHDRPFYHALAVLAGNLPAFAWNKTAQTMRDRLGVAPDEVMAPYLRSIVERFEEAPENSLTGPVARRDAGTVSANLRALSGQPELEALYEAFLAGAWPDWDPDS